MKNLIKVFLAFSVSSSFAFTIDEATTAYNKRAVSAEGFENARLAAKLGIEIGSDESNSPDISARGYLVACKAMFFLGDYLPVSRTEKKVEYKTSSEYCQKGISLVELSLGKAKKEEWHDLLGDLYFIYTSSFGRWFEDESKLRALNYWKDDVKPLLELLDEKMGLSKMYGHGPSRALGRAYFSIPGGRNRAAKIFKRVI